MAHHSSETAPGFRIAWTGRRRVVLWWWGPAVLWCAAAAFGADSPYVTVHQEPVAERIEAFAQVEPMAVLSVQALGAGVVAQFDVMPGAVVKRGQRLGELTGPEIVTAAARAQAAVAAADAKLAAANKALAVGREQLASHLATQQQLLEAESALADATGALQTAQADLASVAASSSVTATTDGTVLAVHAANGQHVSAGETILTIAPVSGLMVKAAVYGADAGRVHVGMKGDFAANDDEATEDPGEPPLGADALPAAPGGAAPRTTRALVVIAVSASGDGGETLWLRPAVTGASLRNGAFGTVTLAGPSRSLVAVPTRALILDQGRWWVLVHTPNGERPQAVQPGASRGWETFIEHGLEPGAEVVVDNAYLEFHRGIAARYQAPD